MGDRPCRPLSKNDIVTAEMKSDSGGKPGFWGQIRWQLAACYLLIGGVSVLLVAAFAATALNLILLRSSTATVERQIDLMVEQSAERAETFASRLLARAELDGSPPERRPPPPRLSTARGPQSASVSVSCQGDRGRPARTEEPIPLPAWIEGDSFQGVVADGRDVWLQAFVRRKGDRCTVETAWRIPVDDDMAALLRRSLELEVTYREQTGPGVGAPPPGAMRGPPSLWRRIWLPISLLWRPLGPVPVAIMARDWSTGRTIDRIPFLVRPDYETTFRQLQRFGQRQAIWVRALWTIGIAFVIVEVIALWLAVAVTHRIVVAVDRLSHAAEEIGQGNLAHRIAIRRQDQLGRLSQTFNHMAESVQQRMEETREKERLQQELTLARQVQEALYPREAPSIPSTDLAAKCLPARNVSGDLYDILPLPGGRVGLLCADVSGKGIPAALLSASVQAMVRSAVQNGAGKRRNPAELVHALNAQLHSRVPDNKFVTLFWAEYDPATRTLLSTNAGHCPPVLLSAAAGDVSRLEHGGPPVGIFPDAKYDTQATQLSPGAVLVLFTDGIPEAKNEADEEFGETRLIEVCRNGRGKPAHEMVDELLMAPRAWAHDAEQRDDSTVVVLKA